jgi:hypothetical protein
MATNSWRTNAMLDRRTLEVRKRRGALSHFDALDSGEISGFVNEIRDRPPARPKRAHFSS